MNESTQQWLADVKSPEYLPYVRAGMNALGVTQADLAQRIGCSTSHVNAVMNRRNRYIAKRFWEAAQMYHRHGEWLAAHCRDEGMARLPLLRGGHRCVGDDCA